MFLPYICQKFDALGNRLWTHDVQVIQPEPVQMHICVTSDDGLVVVWGELCALHLRHSSRPED